MDFVDQLNFQDNYNPRGQFLSVADEKLAKFGGVEGYVQYIRNHFSNEMALFAPIDMAELQTEEHALDRDKSLSAPLDKDEINSELSKICNISLNAKFVKYSNKTDRPLGPAYAVFSHVFDMGGFNEGSINTTAALS